MQDEISMTLFTLGSAGAVLLLFLLIGLILALLVSLIRNIFAKRVRERFVRDNYRGAKHWRIP